MGGVLLAERVDLESTWHLETNGISASPLRCVLVGLQVGQGAKSKIGKSRKLVMKKISLEKKGFAFWDLGPGLFWDSAAWDWDSLWDSSSSYTSCMREKSVLRHLRIHTCGPTFADLHLRTDICGPDICGLAHADRLLRTDICGSKNADRHLRI